MAMRAHKPFKISSPHLSRYFWSKVPTMVCIQWVEDRVSPTTRICDGGCPNGEKHAAKRRVQHLRKSYHFNLDLMFLGKRPSRAVVKLTYPVLRQQRSSQYEIRVPTMASVLGKLFIVVRYFLGDRNCRRFHHIALQQPQETL